MNQSERGPQNVVLGRKVLNQNTQILMFDQLALEFARGNKIPGKTRAVPGAIEHTTMVVLLKTSSRKQIFIQPRLKTVKKLVFF